MRIASSAILFRDGFIAPDLESSCSYLKKKYGGSFPLNEWKEVEAISNTSPLDRLVEVFGLGKDRLEKNAKKALDAANKFLKISSELVIG